MKLQELSNDSLTAKALYPQECNDIVESSHPDKLLDTYRKRCHLLDPLVNCDGPQDQKAIEELRTIVQEQSGDAKTVTFSAARLWESNVRMATLAGLGGGLVMCTVLAIILWDNPSLENLEPLRV